MKKLTFWLFAFLFFFSSCISYDKSFKGDNEKFALEVNYADENKEPKKSQPEFMAVPWGAIVGIITNLTSAALEKESKKYVADYGFSRTFDDFYVDNIVNYSGFVFRRTVEVNGDSAEALKMNINFMESEDKKAFQMSVDDILLSYSKCKVPKFSGDQKVDLMVSIQLVACWLDGKTPVTKVIGYDIFPFKNVEFGKATGSGSPSMKPRGKWIPYFPHDTSGTTGNIYLKVSIIETSDFGDHYAEISKYLSDSSDDLKDAVDKATSKN